MKWKGRVSSNGAQRVMSVNLVKEVQEIHLIIIGKSEAKGHRTAVEVHGEHALSKQSCRRWFCIFKCGYDEIKKLERSGQPNTFDDNKSEKLFYISESMEVDESTVAN